MKYQKMIDQMTIEEKAAILSGKNEWQTRDLERLGIPSILLSDGPHGIRKQVGAGDHLGLNPSLPATCFPTAATVANSWNVNLGEELGVALGEEAAELGVHVVLGPGLNMKRSPLCGRNFEYFSEDPYLAGKMAAAYVKGIQSKGVNACPKHFAVNSQELRRMAMNAVVDERTLREIYLTGFEIAVKEGQAKTIMTSYNQVNGSYANENEHLLVDILRKEWGFDGLVVTDWGGSNDHVAGVAAGSDLEMPTPGLSAAREIVQAVSDGRLEVSRVDACVDRLLEAIFRLAQTGEARTFSYEAHHQLARKAASESVILLKNNDNILPLPSQARVAVIGDFAIAPRYQGAGSSLVHATQIESIENVIGQYDLNVIGISSGYQRTGNMDAVMKKEALAIAAAADIVLYCFGLDEISEVEGMDRTHMRIPENQIELLEAVAQSNPNVIGIISAGTSIEMPWHHNAKAIVHGYLTGQAGATAILDILTGKVNPSGRLSETYPIKYEDTPAFHYYPTKERNSEYREGLYIGYRYYDTGKVRVLYPFGYGLSYTDFAYTNLNVDQQGVSFTLTNTGIRAGAEVAQLYVGLAGAKVFRPEKELKGFARIYLEAGESRVVEILFDDKTFRYWNCKTNQWEVEEGSYQIMIGASVADIRLVEHLTVAGTTEVYPYNKEELPTYYSGLIRQVSDQEYEKLLGHLIPEGKWSGELTKNDAICQMYYANGSLGRWIYKRLTKAKRKSEAKGKPNLNLLFIYNIPFRGIAKMTGGAVSMDMVEGILQVVNGHFFKGMTKIICGYFANARANKEYERKLAGK